MGIGEIIFFLIFAGLGVGTWFFLTGPARLFWFFTFVAIEAVVAFAEIIAKVVVGKTISQLFWDWSVDHKLTAWVVIGMLGIAFGMLLFHLSEKMIFGR